MSTATAINQIDREFAEARAWGVEQGIALKGLKLFLAGSQETICFVATITKNGKVIGNAENDGHGGCTFVHAKGFDTDPRLETYVDELVCAEADRKEGERALKSAVSGLKRSAKRRGHNTIAYKMEGETMRNVTGGNGVTGMNAWLAAKGHQGWTVVSLKGA